MLVVDDMIVQVENPKEFPKKKEKFLELVCEFNKVIGQDQHAKSIMLFSTSKEHMETETKSTMLF